MIGHNPGMEDLVSELAGRPISMPTAAIAIFQLEREPEDGSEANIVVSSKFQLTHFQTPKKLAF